MRHLCFFIFIVLISYNAIGDPQDEALKKTAEAISKTETVKKYLRNVEKTVVKALPINKEAAATISSTALMLANGRVDTTHIKNMDMEVMGGKLRPDVEYNLSNGEVNSKVKLNWNW